MKTMHQFLSVSGFEDQLTLDSRDPVIGTSIRPAVSVGLTLS